MVIVEGEYLLDVAHEHGILDAYASKHFPTYEGDYIAGDDLVSALDWDGGCAWVFYSNGVAPGKEVNFPGLASNSLLVASGSVDPVCNSASKIEEIMTAFGR